MVAVPAVVAVKVTEHEPLTSVHVGELNVPDAVPLAVKLTVPVGVLVGAGEVSVTVAVQVLPWLITTGDVLETTVLVALRVTDRANVLLLGP